MPRVLTARFMHETNTFSRVPTDMAMFRRRDFHLENEIPAAFRGTRSAFGATFEAADKYGWTLIHPVSANPNPSGTVTNDAFETVAGMILGAVDSKGPIDGALVHLHGAMVSDSHEDAEGEFLARLRRRVGPEVPVVVTLDLHANVTKQMADNANALIAYRTYPHIDQYERAWQGAELLERAMRGEIRPLTVIARRPMLYGLDHGRTQRGPMAELIALAKKRPGQINYASSGNGTPPHLAAEMFKVAAGIAIVHVPYKGAGQAMIDLVGGQVQMAFASKTESRSRLR